MYRFLVVLVMWFFTVSLVAGCGQKQEVQKKAAIKPSVTATESAEKEEEAETEEAQPAVTGAPQAVTAPVTQSAKEVAGKGEEAPKPLEEVVIADFDSGEKPNNLNGNFGAWNKDPSDPTQWCKESFDNVTRHGDTGFSMKLDYSVDSPNPAYNGFWMMLPNFNASKYDTLTFWVKGDSKEGYTTVFKVELKNASKQVGRYYVSNVSDQWKQISIPLSEFRALIDKSNLTELVIVFEDRMATKKKGVIYIDDFKFMKTK